MSESSKHSLKNKIIELRKQGKTYNEIVNELHCAKSTISFHCKNADLENIHNNKEYSKEYIKEIQNYYDECKSIVKTKQKFNVSKYFIYGNIKIISKRLTPEERRRKNIDNSLRFRKQNKIKLVEYLGGKCMICGYNKSLSALEFHHINPKEKEFALTYSNKSWDKLKQEADKCILVCANHHREIEDGIIKVYFKNKKIIIQTGNE